MNITFLLGNGFDIQCGLQTSYINFYEYILKKKYSLELFQEMDEKSVLKIDNMIYSEIYKSKDDIQTWADLEFQLGVFTRRLKEEKEDAITAERFLEDFEILREDLNEYLKGIQIQDDVEISEDFSEILSTTMDKFFYGVLEQEHDEIKSMLGENTNSHFNYQFISFNYTNSLQIVLKNSSKNSKGNSFNSSSYSQNFNRAIINVHGVIDRFLTLGLNDESQLASDFFEREDLNDLLKPDSLTNSREYRRRDAESVIEKSDIIVIFGMSIGSTDKHWWERIAEILLKNSNKKLIIHLYDTEPSYVSGRIVRLRREKKENEFLSHLGNLDLSDEKVSQLRKQIYIVTNSQYIINADLRKYLNPVEIKSGTIIDFETKDNKLSETAT
ncbi:AbiH family protein [Enterococcus faecium]|uniref:AbiH family protein n=1 Tax=Enterococcus TaxID=1350 RepID=UPI0004955927|nr:AbiH family protein [Enterococcus gallinarum]MDB7361923.1 AbiH family protein [Enterococcus faecium]MDB7374879.1 AbiH family protein [Enterococcus faecium]MDB7382886.1 AbiH family protein [Enterococcus faecium]MDB7397874.1 AbiH family protein [Enterococcus faecium]MDB7563123.1 AbiH family protein [Enterococcus faecium]